jgi:hypothetical protein
MGNDRYANAPITSFKVTGNLATQATKNEAFTTYFQQATFGTGNTTWWELSATVSSGLQSILRTASRVLEGLLDHDGVLYDAVSSIGENAVLQALSVIAIRYHIVTPATVGNLWSTFLTIAYIPGSDMLEFLTHVEDTARKLTCDGKALTVPRQGPTSRDQLQRIVDAIHSCFRCPHLHHGHLQGRRHPGAASHFGERPADLSASPDHYLSRHLWRGEAIG